MMTNVGAISFILYGVFIFIAFGAFRVLYLFLKKEKLGLEKIDRLVDFFKTVVYATAFSSVALIVANLFEERKQDIKELEYFDKYVDDVKKQGDGFERLRLAHYFSIVAPSGEMKKSWTKYYKELLSEKELYMIALQEIKSDTLKNPTTEQLKTRTNNQEIIERFENPLTTRGETTEWWIVAASDKTMDAAKFELDKAVRINPNAHIIKKGTYYATVLQGYSTMWEARNILHEVQDRINKTAFIVNSDKWCNYLEVTDECLICK